MITTMNTCVSSFQYTSRNIRRCESFKYEDVSVRMSGGTSIGTRLDSPLDVTVGKRESPSFKCNDPSSLLFDVLLNFWIYTCLAN